MIPKDRLLSVREVKEANYPKPSFIDRLVKKTVIILAILILIIGWVAIKP